jgi:hypothetical protein
MVMIFQFFCSLINQPLELMPVEIEFFFRGFEPKTCMNSSQKFTILDWPGNVIVCTGFEAFRQINGGFFLKRD